MSPRKKAVNILRLHIGQAPRPEAQPAYIQPYADNCVGERVLVLPLTLQNWRICLGEQDARALRTEIDTFLSVGAL